MALQVRTTQRFIPHTPSVDEAPGEIVQTQSCQPACQGPPRNHHFCHHSTHTSQAATDHHHHLTPARALATSCWRLLWWSMRPWPWRRQQWHLALPTWHCYPAVVKSLGQLLLLVSEQWQAVLSDVAIGVTEVAWPLATSEATIPATSASVTSEASLVAMPYTTQP